MKFDELDARMRVYEELNDTFVLPGINIVARLDGRSFTRLTKEVHAFEAPFDERMRDHMVATTEHLMTCGFRLVYGYTESDEISLLFHPEEQSFGRKVRKLVSILAGEASACFSLRLGSVAAFDCRICQLPRLEDVRDYFRWRHEDAHRNALNAHCYWMLRKEGLDAKSATARVARLSVADKNELLFQRGINFNELPAWQRRGVGVCWREVERTGVDPRTGATSIATRRELHRDLDLPLGDAYGEFVLRVVATSCASPAS